MKFPLLPILAISLLTACQPSPEPINLKFVATDLTNFWQAYDQIQASADTTQQLAILKEQFINKASPGQQAMFQARSYTPREYLNAIVAYPKFWNSIRANTLNYAASIDKMEAGVKKLQQRYPDLKPATIYFTMGVFRSPGTTMDSMVLIGSEFAFGDNNTNTSEFPEQLSHIATYYQTYTVKDLPFLNVHEYVHTQQNEMVYNNLSLFLYEGIAEFVADQIIPPSSTRALAYGQKNDELVRQHLETDLFINRKRRNWLWNDSNNPFQTSDMGYYVGYAMSKIYYDKADDKDAALKKLIELDYTNEEEIEAFVDGTNYLSAPLEVLYERFESERPQVISIKEFENGSDKVDPDLSKITMVFSKKMNTRFRSTGLGDLGKEHFPEVTAFEFSPDSLSISYLVDLEPNKQYQIVLEEGYRAIDRELPLKPYLVAFKTAR